MSIKKKRFGLEVTHYLTPIFEKPGLYPDGYNEEFHRDMAQHRCSTCQRLFGEHSPKEFVEHWDKQGIPYYATLHREWGDRKCSICERPFSAHSPEEFCTCWDKLGRPEPKAEVSLEQFQQRAMDERKDLVARIYQLSAFFRTELYQTLLSDEQERLQRQLDLMAQYHTVLAERIENFPRDDKPKE